MPLEDFGVVINPHETERKEFHTSFRGYDKPEVRVFLRDLARDLIKMQAELEAAKAVEPISDGLDPESERVVESEVVGLETLEPEAFEAVADETSVDVLVDSSEFGDDLEQAVEIPDADVSGFASEDYSANEDGFTSEDYSANEDGFTSEDHAANEVDDGDERFQALGDRIAGLLKSAHDSASDLRESAEVQASELVANANADAVGIREQAESDAALIREEALKEAEELRERSRADAAEITVVAETLQTEAKLVSEEAESLKLSAVADGEEELRSQREEAEAFKAQTAADHEQAMTELADARSQVADLLAQARSQSDFIKHEADEVIRARVRKNMDQAEQRLNVLRNSEIASRDRIVAAHRELEGAMDRLNSEPVPEFPADPGQFAIDGAEARAELSNFGEIDADYAPLDVDAERADAGERAALAADQGLVEIEVDVLEVETLEADASKAGSAVPGAGTLAGRTGLGIDSVDVDSVDVDSVLVGDDVLDTAIDAVDTGDGDEAEDEDALGRLVRQAMEQAVDSARSTENT